MEKTMIGYKVVSEEHESPFTRCSVTRFELGEKYILKYTPYKLTRPKIKGTRLFAFEKLEEAFDWRYAYGGLVYKAILYNPKKLCGLNAPEKDLTILLKYFSCNEGEEKNYFNTRIEYFLVCTSIKILEQVTEW